MTLCSKANPFAQSPAYWQVVFSLPEAVRTAAEEAFGDMALAVSAFETDEKRHLWAFDLLFDAPPDEAELKRRLMLLAKLHGLTPPFMQVKKIESQDWLAKVARDFPPLTIGRFYVHGRHVCNPPPPGSIAIQVEAGAAFGSGEHGTTSGCLLALEGLARKRPSKSVLDMGCGSGILAIAAAKLWKCPVLAADIDPVAVRVTRENAAINRVQRQVGALVSNGYASERIKRQGPFDVIISNILARPLVEFAPDLASSLAPGGAAVLSGLLASQEAMVLAAHRAQGLALTKRFLSGEWATLVLGKSINFRG